MAQKANPNSYNLQLKNYNILFNSFDSNFNYSILDNNVSELKKNFIRFFERHQYFVKNCFFVYSSTSAKIYLYISFFPTFTTYYNKNLILIKSKQKKNIQNFKVLRLKKVLNKRIKKVAKKRIKQKKAKAPLLFPTAELKKHVFLALANRIKKKIKKQLDRRLYKRIRTKSWVHYFTNLLNLYNLRAYKKIFIFKNLRYLTYFKGGKRPRPKYFKFRAYKRRFWFFRREPYYILGLFLLRVFATGVHNEALFAKFIAKYIKLYHRRKRNFNRFFFFLRKYTAFLKKLKYIKGFKLQLKGRLRGKPRSKQIVFQKGRVPLQTKNSYISYSLRHITTTYGIFGLKIWIHQIPKLFKKKKKIILKSRTFAKLLRIKNKKQKYLEALFPERYKKFKFFKKTKYKKFYNNKGYNNKGYNNKGYNNKGYNNKGYNNKGYNNKGYNNKGFNNKGFNNKGFNNKGFNNKGFNNKGFNNKGFNNKGFKPFTSPNKNNNKNNNKKNK